MSRNKTKLCLGCQRIFEARRDAKTCSPRCRKRYQRARAIYALISPELQFKMGNLVHIDRSSRQLPYAD